MPYRQRVLVVPTLPAWPGCQVQDLRYTYDPAGNVTDIVDNAQQKLYFNNVRVEPSASPVIRSCATARRCATCSIGRT